MGMGAVCHCLRSLYRAAGLVPHTSEAGGGAPWLPGFSDQAYSVVLTVYYIL